MYLLLLSLNRRPGRVDRSLGKTVKINNFDAEHSVSEVSSLSVLQGDFTEAVSPNLVFI